MTAEWPLVRLGDLASIKHGFAFKGEFFSEEPTENFLVTPGNFAVGGGFKLDKVKYYDGPVPDEYKLRSGDLIVTMTDLSKKGDTLGYSGLVPYDPRYQFLHNQRIGLVCIHSKCLDKYFLYFLMRTNEYRNHVLGSATGSTVKHTSPSKIAAYEFRLPPLSIQSQIGETLMSLERKIELNQDVNKTLEQIAQAFFKSWFVDFEPVKAKVAALEAGCTAEDAERVAMQAMSGKSEAELDVLRTQSSDQYDNLACTAALFPSAMVESELGEIPEGWDVGSVSDIATLETQSVKPENAPDEVWEHYSIPAYDDGQYPTFDLGKEIKSNKYQVPDSAILVSKLNPRFPRTWWPLVINSKLSVCSTEFMPFVPVEEGLRGFVAGLVLSEPFQRGMLERVSGSTGSRQRAQPKEVKKMPVILPDRDLIEAFSKRVTPLFEKSAQNIKESRILSELRDTLLPRLLSGELTVPEAEKQTPEPTDV
ncbi:restriction endonuclease subunit S [Halospina sp. K52047b]|uniref:restriction endonuclease subunit S n=1 Tax=Halospina sp. K52047b TaxID=2614160 RepID=UPI001249C62C|nr:restriction endonuclease subunit S [Halospina sp. K52047b]KAA8980823.1 restriction endonuclease subunit S [Halospina sp. K52047b]